MIQLKADVPTTIVIKKKAVEIIYTNELGYLCSNKSVPIEKLDEVIESNMKSESKIRPLILKFQGKAKELCSVKSALDEIKGLINSDDEIILQSEVNQVVPSFLRYITAEKGNNKLYLFQLKKKSRNSAK